jgi:ACS family D-galactonate transporter-like MFS transporter
MHDSICGDCEETMAEAVPHRAGMSRKEWIVVGLLVFSVLVNYVDRSNLSLAVPLLERQFTFSSLRAGELLSAFFWTYALVQFFGIAGWLTDRYSAGWVLMGGYLLWSLAMACLGLAPSYIALFALQLVLGMGESVAYPCYSRIFAAMPQEHRGRANAFIDAGTKLGPAAGAFLGGMVLVHYGWRMLFLAFGIGALVWIVPWYFAMPRGQQAPTQSAVKQPSSTNPGAEPSILKMLRLRCAWGALIGHFCGNYFYYLVLAWLPTYLVQEEHLSIRAMSRLTAAVFLLIACTTVLAGWISDRLIARGNSPTAVRLTLVAGGQATASILLALTVVHGHRLIALGLLAIACIGHGGYASNHWAIAQTLAGPKMAGRWSSLQNGFANFSGIAAPWLTGLIVQTRGSARLAFAVTGAVALIGAASWIFLVRRVEPVQWDTLPRGWRRA